MLRVPRVHQQSICLLHFLAFSRVASPSALATGGKVAYSPISPAVTMLGLARWCNSGNQGHGCCPFCISCPRTTHSNALARLVPLLPTWAIRAQLCPFPQLWTGLNFACLSLTRPEQEPQGTERPDPVLTLCRSETLFITAQFALLSLARPSPRNVLDAKQRRLSHSALRSL